jgi:hypothetical protein
MNEIHILNESIVIANSAKLEESGKLKQGHRESFATK